MIPGTMRAAAIDRFGGPRALKVRRLPVPAIAPNEVLIALTAAGVGSWDSQMRAGWWPAGRPKFPLVLGTDGAGVVAAVGKRVRRFRRGDRVYAYRFASSKGGFYAEYVAVPADKVGRVPRALDLLQAGGAAATALTALQGVDDALGIRKGEAVIIHGASGGVGTLALQFAKRRGARILATASGKDGVALARRLGADEAVDGKRADITAAARRFAPDGIDAVLAFAGRRLPECLDALRRGGRFAFPEGVEPAPRKRRGVKTVSYNAEAGPREFERLGRAITEARLKVPIAAVYPLASAWKAHRRIASGHLVGKIVLRIRRERRAGAGGRSRTSESDG